MQKAVVDAIMSLKENRALPFCSANSLPDPYCPMVDRAYVVENGMLALSGTGAELMDNPEIKAAYFGV